MTAGGASGGWIRGMHDRLYGRGCGNRLLLPDMMDEGRKLCWNLNMIHSC